MSRQPHVTASRHRVGSRGSLKTYTIGFVASLFLTLVAYLMVQQDDGTVSYGFLVFAIISLAVVQLLVQLQFFIHLGYESKPRWNKLILLFMLLVLLIIVIGSLWIMNNLHYNVMSPEETKTYIMEEEGIKR